MLIYMASGAPGSEAEVHNMIYARLLSYFHVINKKFENDKIFKLITNENIPSNLVVRGVTRGVPHESKQKK